MCSSPQLKNEILSVWETGPWTPVGGYPGQRGVGGCWLAVLDPWPAWASVRAGEGRGEDRGVDARLCHIRDRPRTARSRPPLPLSATCPLPCAPPSLPFQGPASAKTRSMNLFSCELLFRFRYIFEHSQELKKINHKPIPKRQGVVVLFLPSLSFRAMFTEIS